MYEELYRLSQPPFANVPDPAFLFLTPQHKRAMSVLQYGLLARAGFCVITGDVGAGKTTLIRSVLRDLDPSIDVGIVSNTLCDSFEEFLRWVLLAFDLDHAGKDKVEMYNAFVKFLVERYRAGRAVTLIIDEAQHLGVEYLEQLRMLSNVNTEKGQILQTILVGQPELWDLLQRPELEQFAQRIAYDYVLSPLEDAEQTGEYIRHRLTTAGGSADLFLLETYEPIWRASQGVPRLINLICDTALVYGYATEAESIDGSIVEQVLADKDKSFASPAERQPRLKRTKYARSTPPVALRRPQPEAGNESDPSGLSIIERAARRLSNDV